MSNVANFLKQIKLSGEVLGNKRAARAMMKHVLNNYNGTTEGALRRLARAGRQLAIAVRKSWLGVLFFKLYDAMVKK